MPRRSTTAAEARDHFGTAPFTTADAAACGISTSRLARAVRLGQLRRIDRGRYVLPRDPASTSSLERYLITVRSALLGRRAVAAGVSAAAVWGLPCPHPWGDWTRLPVTVASPGRIRMPPGAVGIGLGGRTWTEMAGIPVTDVIPTAVDVAWQLPLPEALIVLDAIAARLVGSADRWQRAAGLERIRMQLLQGAASLRSGPGSRRAARALALADASADSPPESHLRGHLALAGAAPPVVNGRVVGATGRGYYADLVWPGGRIIVEVDGAEKYRDRSVLIAEKRREDDLRGAGYHVTRFLASDIFQAGPLLARQVAGMVGS